MIGGVLRSAENDIACDEFELKVMSPLALAKGL